MFEAQWLTVAENLTKVKRWVQGLLEISRPTAKGHDSGFHPVKVLGVMDKRHRAVFNNLCLDAGDGFPIEVL